MVNLLKETIEELKEYGKSPEDVLWVGSKNGDYAISWEEFAKIANIDYDDGYGYPEIATDLVVVGRDWWLERREYDGSEWWEFKSKPKKKRNARKFKELRCKGMKCTLYEINNS